MNYARAYELMKAERDEMKRVCEMVVARADEVGNCGICCGEDSHEETCPVPLARAALSKKGYL